MELENSFIRPPFEAVLRLDRKMEALSEQTMYKFENDMRGLLKPFEMDMYQQTPQKQGEPRKRLPPECAEEHGNTQHDFKEQHEHKELTTEQIKQQMKMRAAMPIPEQQPELRAKLTRSIDTMLKDLKALQRERQKIEKLRSEGIKKLRARYKHVKLRKYAWERAHPKAEAGQDLDSARKALFAVRGSDRDTFLTASSSAGEIQGSEKKQRDDSKDFEVVRERKQRKHRGVQSARDSSEMKDSMVDTEEYTDLPPLQKRRKDSLPELEKMDIERDHDPCEPMSVAEWDRMKLNRVLLDYFLRNFYLSTARHMVKRLGIEGLTDSELREFEAAKKVLDDLDNHSCVEALKWCRQNSRALIANDSNFERRLRAQEFIELIREGKGYGQIIRSVGDCHQSMSSDSIANAALPPAIEYARKHFFKTPTSDVPFREMFGAFMVYNPHTKEVHKKYKHYFEDQRWYDLKKGFLRNLYKVQGMTQHYQLDITVLTGLSHIKSSACEQKEEFNQNCPGCNSVLREVCKSVEPTKRSITRLLCPVTGKIINDRNPACALPTGQIYSSEMIINFS